MSLGGEQLPVCMNQLVSNDRIEIVLLTNRYKTSRNEKLIS